MYINLNIEQYNHLPLLTEETKIFDITRAYLHLPYSVAEYGCGKRADITTKQLFELGIDTSAVRYGMIIEPDLSAAALKQKDHTKRPHSLIAHNPFADMVDFNDTILLQKISRIGATINLRDRSISLPPYYSGKYKLHMDKTISFNLARSHVFLILRFYDLDSGKVVLRVLDPMLDTQTMFSPPEVRNKLHCPEGVLFSSSIGGYFALIEEYLTTAQREKLSSLLGNRKMSDLNTTERCKLIRAFLNNAPAKSIGDPATWTYGNNMQDKDLTYNKDLSAEDRRERHERMGQKIIQSAFNEKKQIMYYIANWSEDKLLPLANLVNVIRVHKSEIVLRKILKKYQDLAVSLLDDDLLDALRGFGVRLRERIDQMAEISKNDYDEIDARTFTRPFLEANIELISQMNRAGMSVFIDRVGNIHGFLTDQQTAASLRDGSLDIAVVASSALGFHSHIDTVFDAGKYDGRLGVLSGLEIAHTIYDLTLQDSVFYEKLKSCPILVSAYVNEEMTYTGQGVSMPGSSAVAGTADIDAIYSMTEPGGKTYRQGLELLIKKLRTEQKAGTIEIVRNITGKLKDLPDPKYFLPKQSIERHCEQADLILKAGIPMTQVDVVMGIHQEDFSIDGGDAETVGLQLIKELHAMNYANNTPFGETHITNGSIRKDAKLKSKFVNFGKHFILTGRRDHAGSTSLEDRYDPALAAAMLSDVFLNAVLQINKDHKLKLQPYIGDFNLFAKYREEIKVPSIARNAIAETATVSLAVTGKDFSDEHWLKINQQLENELVTMTKVNGDFPKKHLIKWRSSNISEIHLTDHLEVTLDSRDADFQNMENFRRKKDRIITDLRKKYDVLIRSSIEQQLDPLRLDESKNVSLILDGSIGGSHNPNEAEYPEVVLAGILVQLAATLRFMDEPDKKIFEIVREVLPASWREKLKEFHSGALHDACQIAAGIQNRKNKPLTFDKRIEKL